MPDPGQAGTSGAACVLAHGGEQGGWSVPAGLAVAFITSPAAAAASDVIVYDDPALEHGAARRCGLLHGADGVPVHRFAAPPSITVA